MKLPDDERFQCYIIDRLVPFPKLLQANGYEGYEYQGKCFCIFHDNENTPSAKLFHDDNGDTLWCFSEQKRYRPSDLYRRKLNSKGSILSVSSNLWSQLDESVQQNLVNDYGKPMKEYVPENWEQNKEALEQFKLGKISFEDHLKLIYMVLQ